MAQPYSIQKLTIDSVDVVRLTEGNAQVSVAPSLGNNAYEFKIGGQAVLWSPYTTPGELKAKPTFLGNPFLAPWANRVDGEWYWANGRKYLLNPELKNYRYDQAHQPIHGLVSYASEWRVIDSGADDKSAWATSRLEFWRRPDWMAQFPLAHAIEMTYRLTGGALEVRTSVENLTDEPMPLAIGFHPYFAIPQRDDWRLHIPAKSRVVLSDRLVPTGERKPMDLPDPLPLRGAKLDDVFSDLTAREFWAENGNRRITVVYGPKYPVAVVYAPPGRDFVCFEPMTALTNAFDLAHEGKYSELQFISPRGKWAESFWIRPTGY